MVNVESKNRIYISFVFLFTVVLVCTILTISSASILNYADANVGTEGIMDDNGDDGGSDDGDIGEDYGNEDDEMETGIGGMDEIVIGCIQGNTCNGMNEEGGNAENDLDKLINNLDLDSEKVEEEEDNDDEDNENIQQSIQTNVCSSGIFPEDIFCENTASQIQGDDNAAAISAHQDD